MTLDFNNQAKYRAYSITHCFLIKRREPADKPGSVVDSHSSGIRVAANLKQPTREHRGPRHRSPIWPCSERGLPCHTGYPMRGALLPHPFTLAWPLLAHGPSAVCFLRHFPSTRVAQMLSGALPCGARTFLCYRNNSDCLADSRRAG